ncbi:MAG: hypothetical protein QXX03_05600 [Nitrososphaerota archaeon]
MEEKIYEEVGFNDSIEEKTEERIEEKSITLPEEIADFWLKPIEHPVDDLCFDIFYVDKNGNWQKVNFPPDPKTGKIVPPFTTDEILNFGFGEGKYIFRPKSIKTGKLLKGSETHYLSKKQEVIEEKAPQRTDNIILEQIVKLQELMIKRMEEDQKLTRDLLFKLIDNMTKQPQQVQPQPRVETDISKVLASFASVLRETERAKADVKVAELTAHRDIELKKIEFKHKIDELLANLGKYPETDEIKTLREQLKKLEGEIIEGKEKKTGIKDIITSIIDGATDFIETLTPLIKAIQGLQRGSSQTQNFTSNVEEVSEVEEVEEEIPQEVLEEVKKEEINKEVKDDNKGTDIQGQ